MEVLWNSLPNLGEIWFSSKLQWFYITKTFNLDNITNESNKEHNNKWPYILDHPYRILIIGGFGSGKTNALFNLVKEQDDMGKIYLYAKDLSEPKYEFLIKKHEDAGIKYLMIQMHFMSAQKLWMTFMRILMTTTQAEKEKFKLFLTTWL